MASPHSTSHYTTTQEYIVLHVYKNQMWLKTDSATKPIRKSKNLSAAIDSFHLKTWVKNRVFYSLYCCQIYQNFKNLTVSIFPQMETLPEYIIGNHLEITWIKREYIKIKNIKVFRWKAWISLLFPLLFSKD